MQHNTETSVKMPKRRSRWGEMCHRLSKNVGAMVGLGIIIALALIALTAPWWIDYDTQVIGQDLMQAKQWPSAAHLMGTDRFGRDIFYRLLYGARFSLSVGVVAVLIGALIGIPLGAIAGYYGGTVENIIMRGIDIIFSIPGLLMGIVLVTAFGQNMLSLMLAVGITSIPTFVGGTRVPVLAVRNQEFVESARAIGMSETKVIFTQVVPNCLSNILIRLTMRIGSAVISASSLSFLGLGVPSPAPEWGSMLSAGREFIRGYSYMTMFPGLAIMITVIAFNMLGDGVRDALDPKLKK